MSNEERKYNYLNDEKVNFDYQIKSEHGEVFSFVPKKVFVVFWSDYTDSGIEKIFYSENKALEYIKYRDKMTGLTYSVDEVDIEDADDY